MKEWREKYIVFEVFSLRSLQPIQFTWYSKVFINPGHTHYKM
jgi:hypothetical protein